MILALPWSGSPTYDMTERDLAFLKTVQQQLDMAPMDAATFAVVVPGSVDFVFEVSGTEHTIPHYVRDGQTEGFLAAARVFFEDIGWTITDIASGFTFCFRASGIRKRTAKSPASCRQKGAATCS